MSMSSNIIAYGYWMYFMTNYNKQYELWDKNKRTKKISEFILILIEELVPVWPVLTITGIKSTQLGNF